MQGSLLNAVIFVVMLAISPANAMESDAAVRDFEIDAKNRPVTKVITLLKDMVNQLEKEGEEDEEVYEKMGCWCVTNEKAKTKSIADAETAVDVLTNSIESLTAKSAQLNTDIANLDAEIKKNTEALETATEVREKELADFTQEEKETLVTINELKQGVLVLSKAHGQAALLKKKSKPSSIDAKKLEPSDSDPYYDLNPNWRKEIDAEAIRASLHGIFRRYMPQVVNAFMQVNQQSIPLTQRRQITAFLQDSAKPLDLFLKSSNAVPATHAICAVCPSCELCSTNFAAKVRDFAVNIAAERREHPEHQAFKAPELPSNVQSLLSKVLKGVDTGLLESGMEDTETGKTKYEPASGQIYGMLKQMKENFETDLSKAQQAEAKASDEYDQMKAAKEEQIQTATELKDKKTDDLARTDEKNAEDKETKEDTEASLAADQAFLADLKDRCASMDAEFAERTKARQLEIEAVSKALAFLSSDEAHELFTRTFNPSFLQVTIKDKSRLTVAKMLKRTALKTKDTHLLRLASKVQENPKGLDTVKKEVTEMIDMLKKEQSDEVKKRDYCIDALNTNEREAGMKERDKDDLEALIDDLKMNIDALEKEIEVLKAEIAELQIELKQAEANRKKENAEFETAVADQRATQKLLAVALKILTDFYKHTFLVQTNQKAQKVAGSQAPPPGFRKAEKSAASGGVMGMMQSIIDDAKAMEAECIRAEEKAQKDFDDMVKDTRVSIETKTNDIETKSVDKAKAEEDKVQALADMDATITELETLTNEEHDLHKECDFVLKNFETSQAARSDEIESLKQANQIFSGASFAFLQFHTSKHKAQ